MSCKDINKMSFSPQALLSNAVRERYLSCVSKLKMLPIQSDPGAKPMTNASILVPLCVVDGEVNLLYTLRSSRLKNHGGQVSFPGGKMDKNENFVETALRETEEEIGVSRHDVDIWGQMSPVPSRNKEMLITPVVGVILNFNINKLVPNKEEVEEIFTVPMSALCDTSNHACLKYKPILLPVYLHGNHKIWGITGLITHLFLDCFLPENLYKVDFTRRKFELHELMPSKL